MANRRMFAKDVLETDDFLELPGTSQLLYFWLGVEADDDGFIQPRRVMRMIGAKEDDLRILMARQFVIPFEDKVVVIRDWRRHNEIRQDRYKPTQYQQYKSMLYLDVSSQYTFGTTSGTTTCTPRIGEDRRGETNVVASDVSENQTTGKGYQEFKKMRKSLAKKKAL